MSLKFDEYYLGVILVIILRTDTVLDSDSV